MTDARAARYDELYPALGGLSGNNNNTSNNNGNRINTNSSLLNNNNNNNNNINNVANSWSAHAASGHQQQNKLNYIQQIQNLYQQQQQHQHQQQQSNTPQNQSHEQQQQQQSQQQQQQQQPPPSQQQQQQPHQQVLNHLVENDQSATNMVTQHHNSQPTQPQQQQFVANNTILANNNTMQANNFEPAHQQQQQQQQQQQPQMQARRPAAQVHQAPALTSERCCTFKIAPEERRYRDFEMEQFRILKEIMQKTSTKIEITTTKDGALNFCIIGKELNLTNAKNLVLNDFRTGVTLTVSVPRAIYGRLLGPKGQRLANIQQETQTKITIPKKEEDSDIIKIVGSQANAELAVRAIEDFAREFASKTTEKVTVERIYILFITGPFNENLKRWEEMGAKVSTSGGLLPSKSDRESGHADEVTFSIVGETSVVNQVKDEIVRLYEDKKKKCTTVNIEVKKAQHKYILGPAGHNLRQLFDKTGVSVELPHESESETITLRGERSKMAPALSELYTQAHSETDDYFEVELWLHKYLIGSKKTNFLDFKALGVDVKSLDDRIKLHGPPTEIENILDIFETELAQLRKNIIRKDVSVEARIHGYIIGRSGATVDQIREESGANVIVPKNDEPSELITLEGTREAVAIAEEKINAIAKRYEASRKLVIDQQLHGSIIGRGGEKIRSIREKFSKVIFSFPELGSKHNEITIVGPKEEVEECYKYLDELHQQIQENNQQVQVVIDEAVLPNLSDAKNAIKRIKVDHQVKIDLFLASEQASKEKEVPAGRRQQQQASPSAPGATEEAKKKGAKSEAKSKGASDEQQPNGVANKTQGNRKASAKNNEQQGSTAAAAAAPAAGVGSGGKKSNAKNYAIIIGKKENVEAAKPKFTKLLEEFASMLEVEIKVATSLRDHLGPRTRLYRQFCDEFHGKVSVIFPPMQRQQQQQQANKQQAPGGDEAAASSAASTTPGAETNGTAQPAGKAKNKKGANKVESQRDGANSSTAPANVAAAAAAATELVKIRGPKQAVKKAEERFGALVAECRERIDRNFTIKIDIDPAIYDKFARDGKLIKLKTIRDTLNVRLLIPDKREAGKQLVCTIVGHEKDALKAQKQFEQLYQDVAESVDESIEIASAVHPRLIGTQGRAVKKLMDNYRITVKFARPGDQNPNLVVLSGRQKNIDQAKAYMQRVAEQFFDQRNAATASNSAQAAGNNVSDAMANGDGANVANNDDNSQQKPHETAVTE